MFEEQSRGQCDENRKSKKKVGGDKVGEMAEDRVTKGLVGHSKDF